MNPKKTKLNGRTIQHRRPSKKRAICTKTLIVLCKSCIGEVQRLALPYKSPEGVLMGMVTTHQLDASLAGRERQRMSVDHKPQNEFEKQVV